MGLAVHAMAGFDAAAAAKAVGLPPDHAAHCIVALGWPGDAAALPEKYREKETPNDRRSLADLAFEGRVPARG